MFGKVRQLEPLLLRRIELSLGIGHFLRDGGEADVIIESRLEVLPKTYHHLLSRTEFLLGGFQPEANR